MTTRWCRDQASSCAPSTRRKRLDRKEMTMKITRSQALFRAAAIWTLILCSWNGTSDSFNPKSAKKVIDGLVKLIVKELTKQEVM
jgi:hypothetical protein